MTGRVVLLPFLAWVALAAPHPDWQNVRKQMRETLHVSDPLPKLESKSYGSFAVAPDVAADRVS